jgi:hypothetical protein
MESSLKDEVRLMAETCEAVYARIPEAMQVPSASDGPLHLRQLRGKRKVGRRGGSDSWNYLCAGRAAVKWPS